VEDIHVRAVWLNGSREDTQRCRALLSADEIARADRFAFAHLTRSFEIAHGALRLLLAAYLNTQPQRVQFTYGSHGKPALTSGSGLRFNMAHSRELALYAFTAGCEIGVDVEQVRSMPDLESIAQRFFNKVEVTELMAVQGGPARTDAFFRCWTRKEAYMKAVGEGLSMGLDQVPGPDWNVRQFVPAESYAGAVAYQGERRQLTVHSPTAVSDVFATAASGRLSSI